MASWRLLANENRDNSNRIDYAKQTPIRLFEDWDGKQPDIEAEQANPRDELWVSCFSLPSYTPELFVTSPTKKKTIPVPPNAPIKSRKPFSKVGLKPKKLRFTDKERREMESENCFQKSADYSMRVLNQKAEFSKQHSELKGKLNRENLSAMLQNIQLEIDNKENRQYESKMRDGRFVAKERTKNSNNPSQSLKVNCNQKDRT